LQIFSPVRRSKCLLEHSVLIRLVLPWPPQEHCIDTL
jgi:hypothetical protein